MDEVGQKPKRTNQLKVFIHCWLIVLSSLATTSAQNISSKTFYLLDEQKGEMIPDQELRWYYDASDQDTLNEAWLWEEERNSFQLSFRRQTTYGSSGERLAESTSFWERSGIRISQKEWEYDNKGRNVSFSEYRKNANENVIRGFSRWEKSYTSQGCLDAQTYFQGGTIWRPLRRTRYFYGDNCQVDSTLDEAFDEGDWQATGRSLMLYQDTVISTTASLWQNESWVFNRRLTTRYDAQGYLLESKILYPDSSQFRQENRFDALGNQTYYAESQLLANDSVWEYFLAEEKTYDPQNRVLTQRNLFDYSRALQQFMSRNERTRFYDEKGRIIAENSLLIDRNLLDSLVSETLFSFEYEEYCDGLLRGEEAFREATSPKERISRVEYGYENAAACKEEAIGLRIAPNPVSDELSFYAETLMEANTQISIYDLQQRLVHAERVPYRTSHYIVPVQALTAGYYYLRVGGAERSHYAKFVKLP